MRVVIAFGLLCCLTAPVSAQLTVEQQVKAIETRQETTLQEIDRLRYQVILANSLLCAFFCAAWAQTTGRSAVLWFVFGLLAVQVALIALLVKNTEDRAKSAEKTKE